VTEALQELKREWNIHDTWRRYNPNTKAFTYQAQTQTDQIQVRLDRVYVSSKIEQQTFDWEIKETAVPTDHSLVTVRYVPRDAPYIGPGRWSMPLHLLANEKLMNKISTRGIQLQAEMTRIRIERTDREETNPQRLWETFKKDVKQIIKETEKDLHHKMTSKIKALENDIKNTNNNPDGITNKERRTHVALLTSQLKQLQKKKARCQTEMMRTKIAHHGDKMGGIWSAIGKEKKPRNPIFRLKVLNANPAQYERNSKNMAELARRYHETLQIDERDQRINDEERDRTLSDILGEIPNEQKIPDPERTTLNWKVTEEQITEALKRTKDGSATGLDGCPYELWKSLEKRHNTN
jgi:hypothetical protein